MAVKCGIVALLRYYKAFISPLLPNSCRYYPSCSSYAIEAVEKYGITAGLWLSVKRLLRCGPWHRGGYDPVP